MKYSRLSLPAGACKEFLLIFLVCAFTGVIIPYEVSGGDVSSYLDEHDPQRFFSDETGPDRALILDERIEAGAARLHLIETAEKSLEISYYTLRPGMYLDVYAATLLEAADRGVEIRLLLDGMFGTMRSERDLRRAIILHQNIQLKFYEPFSLLRPWAWNNRLHDKYMIMDNTMLITGGANIGDRYFIAGSGDDITYDRDVLIICDDLHAFEQSVLFQAADYFDYLWNHQYSVTPSDRISTRQEKRAAAYAEEITDWAEEFRVQYPHQVQVPDDWYDRTVPTNAVTLIHNPIERGWKEPWVWAEITRLFESAEDCIYVQSPYVIPNRQMRPYIGEIQADTVQVIANSAASSPNLPAIAGHANFRRRVARNIEALYEYQGEGSIHGKSIMIDNRLSLIGGFNIDPRSTFFSTESMLVIDSEPLADQLKQSFETITNQSLAVLDDGSYEPCEAVEPRRAGILKRGIIAILRIVTYPITFLL